MKVVARDMEMPALGFGTFEMKGEECREAVRHALDLGCLHLDTAQGYDNEQDVGAAMAAAGVDRDDLWITTKIKWDVQGPDAVPASVEASLRRLGTDYVDLLLIHWPVDNLPIPGTVHAMKRLQDEGKVRHIGVSNFPRRLVEEALEHGPIAVNQVEYHPYLAQRTLLDTCAEHDLALTAYSPLARGNVADDATLREIGAAHGKSGAQVALRWLLQQERVAAIPKSATAERRAENMDVYDFELTPEEMERIHGLARGERLINPEGMAPEWDED